MFHIFLEKLKLTFKQLFWKNKVFALMVYLSLAFNALIWGGMFWLTKLNQPVLVKHFNVFFGIDKVVNLNEQNSLFKIAEYPAIGLAILLLNFFLAVVLYYQTVFWDRAAQKVISFEEKNQILALSQDFIMNANFIATHFVLAGVLFVQVNFLVYMAAILNINMR